MKKKWDKRFLAGCIASVIVFGAVMGLFVNGVFSFLVRARSEGSDTPDQGDPPGFCTVLCD
ncbi:MAG: hypothetical protein ACLUD2_18300 [Clostridium sp.]